MLIAYYESEGIFSFYDICHTTKKGKFLIANYTDELVAWGY
jgi:hypothetical protein